MKTIWKYELKSKTTDLEIPRDGKVLCVQMQGKYPCLWVLVDGSQKQRVARRFTAISTGEEFDGKGDYLGTVQIQNIFDGVPNPVFVSTPTIVHHIFEREVKPA